MLRTQWRTPLGAVSYGRAGEQLWPVEWEIEQLLAKAEADDAQPLQDGLSLEGELARRHERKARLQQARAEIEARAFARAQQERARKAPDQPGPPAPPTPAATDQYNYTDPQSRIMPVGGKTRFEQNDNAQAAVGQIEHHDEGQPTGITVLAGHATNYASKPWSPFSESASKPSDSSASCSAVWRKCRWNGSS
jgi:hypothetical protein